MNSKVLEFLVCPKCSRDLDLSSAECVGDEIITGTLSCRPCGLDFQVTGGIPRMVRQYGDMQNVATSFGFQWAQYFQKRFEYETLFGRTAEQDLTYYCYSMDVSPEDIKGRVVLDAGCGSGKPTKLVADLSPRAIIGIDISSACEVAYKNCRDLPNVHIIQADIFDLPFRPETFDYIWSNGVIHHTPSAEKAFEHLANVIKKGGKSYVWVYSKAFSPFRYSRDILIRLGLLPRLSLQSIYLLSRVLAALSFVPLAIYRSARRIPGLKPKTAKGVSTVRNRSFRELCFTWFDTLSPEYDSRHTAPEVQEWFARQGFTGLWVNDYAVSKSKVDTASWIGGTSGVGVRGVKA